MPCTESCRSTERERMHQNAGFHMPQVPGMGRKPWASRLAHSGRGERKDHAAHRAVCRVCVCVKSRVRSALCSRSFCGDWCRCVATCFCVTVSRDKTSYTTTHHAISVARAPSKIAGITFRFPGRRRRDSPRAVWCCVVPVRAAIGVHINCFRTSKARGTRRIHWQHDSLFVRRLVLAIRRLAVRLLVLLAVGLLLGLLLVVRVALLLLELLLLVVQLVVD